MIRSKTVMVGSISTGKSSLIHRLVDNQFDANVTSTTGALYYKKSIHLPKADVQLNIWDTAGQERFRSISKMYFRNATVFVLVFDLNNISTFNDLTGWIELIQENCIGKHHVVLVGNKKDLIKDESMIRKAEEFAFLHNFPFFATSCKAGENITEVFHKVAELSTQVETNNDSGTNIEKEKQVITEKAQGKKCC